MTATPPIAPKPTATVSFEYPAKQASVEKAIVRLRSGSWCRGAGAELMSSLEIVLAEALNNVIEHACAGLNDRRFRLSCRFDGRTVSISIEDDGRAMPHLVLPAGSAPSLAVPKDELPEGGFGWFLIRSICNEVKYTRAGSLNRLDLELIKV